MCLWLFYDNCTTITSATLQLKAIAGHSRKLNYKIIINLVLLSHLWFSPLKVLLINTNMNKNSKLLSRNNLGFICNIHQSFSFSFLEIIVVKVFILFFIFAMLHALAPDGWIPIHHHHILMAFSCACGLGSGNRDWGELGIMLPALLVSQNCLPCLLSMIDGRVA